MKHAPEDDDMIDLFAPSLDAAPAQEPDRMAMQQRLLARIAASKARHRDQLTVRQHHRTWRTIKPGVRSTTLHIGQHGASVLIALDPDATLPVHRHRHFEEGIVLAGSMQMGDLDLGPGDYHSSMPGSRHARITSRDGCMTYLRGTSLGEPLGVMLELLGGLLPGDGEAPITVATRDGEWMPVAPGIDEKRLWHDERMCSRFLRFAPGSRLRVTPYSVDTEFLVVSGDVFCGDILVQHGEFHFAPAGTGHDILTSDGGATVFVSGADALLPRRSTTGEP